MAFTSLSSSSSSSTDSEWGGHTETLGIDGLNTNLSDRVLDLEKTKTTQAKEIADLKKKVKKLERKRRSRNPGMNLFKIDSQVSDKSKAGLGYKVTSHAVESSVISSEMLENQENGESRLDKGYHAVPPPFTGNYMTPKCDLRHIDEHFESVSVDVISNNAPSDVKTIKTIDVNHKCVFSTEAPKPVMKNKFSPPIIEDCHSDDESETKSAQAKETADLKKRVKKLERKRRSRTPGITLFNIGTCRRSSLGEDDTSKKGRNLKHRSIFEESIFDVQAMMDADYELAARLRAEE
uniref:Uncharacterized protein n=1 Tax=Tanacetum cinerariifolium TaxID=118510 RepID=A0A6L2LNN7_TANCI|nr:hypothetical protein [Tanacetum cinerariifolium]